MFSEQIGRKIMTSQKQTKLVNLNLLWSGSIKMCVLQEKIFLLDKMVEKFWFLECISLIGVIQNAGSWSANEFLFKKDN